MASTMFHKNGKSRTPRLGSVYVAVLGCAIIVAVIGISSLHIARLEVRESMALDEMARARIAARSGIECAIYMVKTNPFWRTTYENAVLNSLTVLSNYMVGSGTFNFTLTDTDGDLDDNDEDAVSIRCVGTAGSARHVIEVMLQPTGDGLSCLSASLHSAGDIALSATLTTNQTISTNGSISSAGSIQGNAQAVGSIAGNPSGTKNQNMSPALEMPDPTSVFEYYLSVGTPITFSQIPGGIIQLVVLSSTSNPYGSQVPNQQGIYVVDCQGNNLTIRNARIQGTLVLINAGPLTTITNSVNWKPMVANFPALMVQGPLTMNWTQTTSLIESTLGVNFNPAHSPYEGASDSTNDDTYPSKITGLVYTTGNLSFTNQVSITGAVVVGGTVSVSGASGLTYSSLYLSNAPPGFTSGTDMKLMPGTWKQVAY